MSRPRMLVTGGSGYLGGWVVQLARTDWEVTATYFTHPVDEPGVTWHRLDVRDGEAVETLAAGVCPAIMVHTVASNPREGVDFEGTIVAGTRHVARAAAVCGARLIHISTDVLFDGKRGN